MPLLRVRFVRPRAPAQLAVIAGLGGATPRGEHGDRMLVVVAPHGGMLIAGPVFVGADHADLLLTTYFDAMPSMLQHLLADADAQRRYAARGQPTAAEPPSP